LSTRTIAVDTRAVPIDEAERVGTAELRSSGIQVPPTE
jgi:hypothetical protein